MRQAAEALAEHASRNAGDAEYESPYTEEAIRCGMDLPWWQKIVTTTLDFGELKLGKLTVRAPAVSCCTPLHRPVNGLTPAMTIVHEYWDTIYIDSAKIVVLSCGGEIVNIWLTWRQEAWRSWPRC